MSTPAIIALDLQNGGNDIHCAAVYCHNDGYPSYMYHMLNNHYNNLDRVLDLISFGNASSIRKNLVPTKGSNHSFDHPEKDISIFYHRDRGEPWDDVGTGLFKKEHLLALQYYVYIYENDAWHLYVDGKEVTDLANCE